jgi:hypothetical protein
MTKYFDLKFTSNLDWWGWIYRTKNGNIWINAITGNTGDVI